VDSAVDRGHCSMHGELPRRRGRAREGLAGIVLDVAIEVLMKLFGRERGVGILVKDFLSNDCVSLCVPQSDARYCHSQRSKCGVWQPSQGTENGPNGLPTEYKRPRSTPCFDRNHDPFPILQFQLCVEVGTQLTGGDVVL
jgi:hypothetical protein